MSTRFSISVTRVDEAADRCFVRQVPTEIDLHFDDLRPADGDDFGIAKAVATGTTCLIRDEHLLAVLHQVDELKPLRRFAVGPATVKIGRTVKAGVKRAGEMKIVGNQRFNRNAILRDIGLISGSRD